MLLRHDLPGGVWHYDWMIDPEALPLGSRPDEVRLMSFRLGERPPWMVIGGDGLGVGCRGGAFDAVRIHAHRARYLFAEGLVRGGSLGVVRRLWRARCAVLEQGAARVVVRVGEGERSRVWVGERVCEIDAAWGFQG